MTSLKTSNSTTSKCTSASTDYGACPWRTAGFEQKSTRDGSGSVWHIDQVDGSMGTSTHEIK